LVSKISLRASKGKEQGIGQLQKERKKMKVGLSWVSYGRKGKKSREWIVGNMFWRRKKKGI
jgi:hypothetical protein